MYKLYSAGPDIDNTVVTYPEYLFKWMKLDKLLKNLLNVIGIDKLLNINTICKAAGANVVMDEEEEPQEKNKNFLSGFLNKEDEMEPDENEDITEEPDMSEDPNMELDPNM